ncbi:unnamed protein product [Rotaria sp. Silwood1]|nr:unnamed protein product [Rotaria sp. Silwood1]CAF4849163.1 unnamed protein product [Rotaria sp. Silwood1]
MADYLSRSSVEIAEEDIEEQTDVSFSSLNNNLIPLKMTTASTTPIDEKINELIQQWKVAMDKEPIEQLSDENPNKTILFNMNDLKKYPHERKTVQGIMKNIRRKKHYFIEHEILFRRQPPLPLVLFVPKGCILADILKTCHNTHSNEAHF